MLHFSSESYQFLEPTGLQAEQKITEASGIQEFLRSPKRLDTVLTVAYILTLVVWGVSRILSQFDINPEAFAFASRLGIALSGLALFAWVTNFTGLWRNIWLAALLLLGSSFYVLLLLLLVVGSWLDGQVFSSGNGFGVQISPVGFLAISVVLIFYFAAFSILWAHLFSNGPSLVAEESVASASSQAHQG